MLASMLRPDTPSALLLPEVSLALVLTPLVDDAMSRLVVPVAVDEPGVWKFDVPVAVLLKSKSTCDEPEALLLAKALNADVPVGDAEPSKFRVDEPAPLVADGVLKAELPEPVVASDRSIWDVPDPIDDCGVIKFDVPVANPLAR